MRDSIYDFREDDIKRFAEYCGVGFKRKGSEAIFKYCPYCNGGKSRDRETFAISLLDGRFNCKRSSCGVTGNMLTLAREFQGFELTEEVTRYLTGQGSSRYRTFRKDQKWETKQPAIEYLESRSISKEVVQQYEITSKSSQDNILVFPFKDSCGNLISIKYRKTNFDKSKDKNKEWFEADCKPILFGMQCCKVKNKQLIITEGQIDALSVAEAFLRIGDSVNVVSVPNGCKAFTWIPYCFEWIENNFDELIIFGDYEHGKISLFDTIQKRFKAKLVKSVRFEDYKDCKDANEILTKYGSEQIKACITNAKPQKIKRLKNLSEVKDIDLSEIPKLSTGIERVDREILKGGLPFGGVTVLTGRAGEGKSTFASQLLIEAIEQKHICMAYSGELPAWMFKNWIHLQAAGMQNLISYRAGQWNDEYYKVSDGNKGKINSWMDGKLYLYDGDYIEDEEDERKTIVDIIEDSIRRYGVDVVLIDNLMTAMLDEDIKTESRFDKQYIFMNRIRKISLENNVLIILIAHKRKGSTGNDNDDISGASEIANLATVTMSYGKIKDAPDDEREFKIIKNRLTGISGSETMLFQSESKRIFSENDRSYQTKTFSWKTEEDFETNLLPGEIPFD